MANQLTESQMALIQAGRTRDALKAGAVLPRIRAYQATLRREKRVAQRQVRFLNGWAIGVLSGKENW